MIFNIGDRVRVLDGITNRNSERNVVGMEGIIVEGNGNDETFLIDFCVEHGHYDELHDSSGDYDTETHWWVSGIALEPVIDSKLLKLFMLD